MNYTNYSGMKFCGANFVMISVGANGSRAPILEYEKGRQHGIGLYEGREIRQTTNLFYFEVIHHF